MAMLDDETIKEIAKATGKSVDLIRSAGKFLDGIFGDTLRQVGGIPADWARYYRAVNSLRIADKVKAILDERQISGKPIPLSLQHALPLLDGASLESEDEIQNLWAALIANATDPNRALRIKKVYIEILRGLEPLDARIMEFLFNPGMDQKYSLSTGTTLNAEELAVGVQADVEDVKISLQTLARYSCAIDAWENTLESLDAGYSGFRVNNPKSNFRLSHLGMLLVLATRVK
jgi:Abortive infection alpha